ncbi:OPT oligopeptide transporter protein-domain-containing protein [Lipomyces kononenkoae]|uniref:OPT oligopeptide transporter protein-domain-containing protein n=1 Tax=Lipomyces kononenkoae TaxID=34357 RepID=A0ACC3SS03_LIPKO
MTDTDQGSISTEQEKKSVEPHVRNLDIESNRKILEDLDPERAEEILGQSQNIDFILDKISTISIEESTNILKGAIEYHEDDPNFPRHSMDKIKALVNVSSEDEKYNLYEFDLKFQAVLIGYVSPYPEVRSIVEATDDPTIPVETFRVYLLGFIYIVVVSAVNQFFTTRQPHIGISAAIIQILLYPSGKFLAMTLPDWGFTLFGTRYALNPGPWTFKEQMLTHIMMGGSLSSTNVTANLIPVLHLDIFYGYKWVTIGFQLLIQFSTQLIGIGLAGTMRRWAVYPVRCLWPQNLAGIALNRALVKSEQRTTVHGWSISRYWFFWVIFACSFFYYWIPGYLFTALSTFNWMNWIAPNNFNLAAISGSTFGLGFNPITTFDWTVINHGFGPLTLPFYTAVNQYIGLVLSAFAIIGMYWANYKYTAYMPINSNTLMTNTGAAYNVQKVITDGLLDIKKYQKYSPPFYSAGSLFDTGSNFFFHTIAVTSIFLSEWKTLYLSVKDIVLDFKNPVRSTYSRFQDVHSRMMARYKEVPDWWFYIVLVGGFALSVAAVTAYPTRATVPGLLIAYGITILCLIPIVLLQAIAGVGFGTGAYTDIISGYLYPGNGTSMMIMRISANAMDSTAASYVSNQKDGHYAKIPPRAIFRVQILGTVLQCLVTVGVVNWQMSNMPDLCTTNQPQKFKCAGEHSFYNTSIAWGVIGPRRMFNDIYPVLKYCFLMGFLVSFPLHFIKLKFRKQLKYFNPILVVAGMGNWAPYNLSYYTPGFYVSIAFMYVIRKRYLAWWEKYNYILHSGLTSGVAFGALLVFFTLQYNGVKLSWWGNNASSMGIDGGIGRQTLLPLPKAGYFGPAPGHYP